MKRFIVGIMGVMFCTVVLIGISAGQADARVYKYVDKAGQMHYTNDPSTIPPEYRESIQSKSEIAMQPSDAAPEEGVATTEAEKVDEIGQQLEAYGMKKLQQLRDQDRALQQEYEALVKEREEIAAQQKEANTAKEVIETNARVEALNKKFADYKQRHAEHKAAVREYDQQVRTNIEKRLQRGEERDVTARKKALESTSETSETSAE